MLNSQVFLPRTTGLLGSWWVANKKGEERGGSTYVNTTWRRIDLVAGGCGVMHLGLNWSKCCLYFGFWLREICWICLQKYAVGYLLFLRLIVMYDGAPKEFCFVIIACVICGVVPMMRFCLRVGFCSSTGCFSLRLTDQTKFMQKLHFCGYVTLNFLLCF